MIFPSNQLRYRTSGTFPSILPDFVIYFSHRLHEKSFVNLVTAIEVIYTTVQTEQFWFFINSIIFLAMQASSVKFLKTLHAEQIAKLQVKNQTECELLEDLR